MMKRDEVELMFQSVEGMRDLPDYTPASGGDAVSLYIDVDDVDSLYATIKDRDTGGKDLGTTFYGAREFHIGDCNGYLVGFAHRPRQH